MSKDKFGFWSIVLLGINAIIGSGIFLLPNQAYSLVGVFSLVVIVFDMVLATCMALCFAELSGLFKKNGGPYVYAKAAFGDFVGFEVGFMKAAVSIIAWATMANGFVTALASIWPLAGQEITKKIIIIVLIGVLAIVNIMGVNISRTVNNVVTIGKVLPLIIFIAIGIFFINGGNFTPLFLNETYQEGTFGAAALVIFYAFVGFESIASAAEDMDNPDKNLPRAIVVIMIIVSIIYVLIQTVSIGILGADLAKSTTPVAQAAAKFIGSGGGLLVTAGTLVSIGGVNMAASFLTPRNIVAMADDKLLPSVLSKYNKRGTPYAAIIFSAVLAMLIAVSGTFTQLAAISVVSRFTQYVPTCLAVIILRKKNPEKQSPLRIPFGPVIPIVSVIVSMWLITQSSMDKIIIGLGGLLIGIPFYFVMKKSYS